MYGQSLDPDMAGSNIHYCYCSDPPLPTPDPLYCCPAQEKPSDIEVGSYAGEFHTYAVQWDPDKIIWYYDGYPARVIPNHGFIDPARIILNLAARWVDHDGIQMDVDVYYDYNVYFLPPVVNYPSTPVSIHMYVDYIRVYKLKEACDDVVHTNQFNDGTYPDAVVNYVSLGNGGEWPSGLGETFIRGSNYVDLTAGYTFPVGSNVYLEAVSVCQNDLTDGCNEIFTGCSISEVNANGIPKESYEIGGMHCGLAPGFGSQNAILRAAQFIAIAPTTELLPPLNGSIVLDISTCE